MTTDSQIGILTFNPKQDLPLVTRWMKFLFEYCNFQFIEDPNYLEPIVKIAKILSDYHSQHNPDKMYWTLSINKGLKLNQILNIIRTIESNPKYITDKVLIGHQSIDNSSIVGENRILSPEIVKREKIKEFLSKQDFFSAVQAYGHQSNKSLDSHWEFLKPYFKIIDRFELDNIDKDHFKTLKSEYMLRMIEFHPFKNFRLGLYNKPTEQYFSNELYKVIMNYTHKVELEKLIDKFNKRINSSDSSETNLILVNNNYGQNFDRTRCEACGIVAQNEPFDIKSVPELPLPQCTRMKCHCFYQEDGLDPKEVRLSYRQYRKKSLDLD